MPSHGRTRRSLRTGEGVESGRGLVVVTFGGPKSPERFLKVVNFSQKSLSDDDDDVFPEFLVFDWIKHVKGLFLNNDLNKFLLW